MHFLDQYKEFKKRKNKQRLRGLNDYNIFAALFPGCSDEVRLHSGFIYSMLNPDGAHYQDALFLELFIKAINIESFGLNTETAYVKKEYQNIDIYISDGERHIILENKIYAQDQERQIARYIENIEGTTLKENENKQNCCISSDNIYVIYLSIDRDEPQPHSIDGYEKHGEYLVDKTNREKKVLFKAIKYKKDIYKWLELSANEVENITNLHFAIIQYQEAVKMMCGDYRKRGATTTDFMGHDGDKWDFISKTRSIRDVELFINSDVDRDIMQEILSERDKLMLDGIDIIAEELLDYISKTDEFIKNAIDSLKVLRKSNELMYTDSIYMDISLKNDVIIQLEYTLELIPRRINLKYYTVQRDLKDDKAQFSTSMQAFSLSISDLICSKEKRQEWLECHGKEFIKQLKKLIEKSDEYLQQKLRQTAADN